MTSPFGNYGPIVSSILGILVVFAAVLVHVFPALATAVSSTDWVDNAALLVIGIAFGTRAGMNGAGQIAVAAHNRLDKIGAPPADAVVIADGAK